MNPLVREQTGGVSGQKFLLNLEREDLDDGEKANQSLRHFKVMQAQNRQYTNLWLFPAY